MAVAPLWITADTIQNPASIPVVKIKHMEEVVCAGVLIAPQWVLTVASCLTLMTPMAVEVENDVVNVTGQALHPLYNVARFTFNLVLLQLSRAAAARPAMLDFDVLAPRTQVVARGYANSTSPLNASSSPARDETMNGTTISNVECVETTRNLADDVVCIVSLCGVKTIGSPAVVVKNGQEAVVALLGWTWHDCTHNYMLYERIASAKSFLEPFLPDSNACAMSFQRPHL
ncbi:hypothetical protein Ae201684P_019509 [Aphanomyces euteiches]|uniref:Peptidase S1 domain-containing protein n=1 Tax=Aphanomyces euteiches TaxID=100861 RepID=A0A6G0WDU8_9STRA|nr:hypothetical protein Ae201684_016032 [Aphanomyces euteiches]KAH9078422.1 hypothetical protein Ae201684P_019509 [Aphanomyces euteiches]